MKKTISLIVFVTMLFLLHIPIGAKNSNIEYYSVYESIKIKGETDPASTNRFVTVILKNGNNIINMAEVQIDNAGKYDYVFRAIQMTDEVELVVKCADEDITDTVYEAILETDTVAEISYEVTEEEEQYRITADLTEFTRIADRFTVVAAQYNETGKLMGCDTFKSDLIGDISFFNELIDKKGTPKLFVWTSLSELIPAASTKEGDGGLILRFGMLADKQYREGYAPITGDNNYERYINAKSELPEEMNVITPQQPKIKRAFYVSADGSNDGTGEISSPFATIDKAIEEYANLTDAEKEEWTAVYIMGGKYELDAQINITDKLAGVHGSAKLLIGAYDGDEVLFQSTRTVSGDKLIKVSKDNTPSDVMGRINSDVDNLYFIKYSDLGIDEMNGYEYGTNGKKPILMYNDVEGTLARYPNGGDTYIEKVIDSGYDDDKNYTENVEFIPTDKRPFTWYPSSEIGISGQLCVTWYYNHMQTAFDYENQTVKTPSGQTVSQGYKCAVNLVNHPEDRAHFYYYNVFEEIDMPGEWCSSNAEQRIYIYPGKTVLPEDEIKISGAFTDYSIKAENISDLVVDGIHFDTLGNGVEFFSCERAVVQNCEFNNITKKGVSLSHCKKTGVINSDFRNCYNGVNIDGGREEIINLVPSRNFIQNCYFNTIGETCIYIGETCGNVVSHNLAENYNGSFIGLFGGCENIIEHNETYAGGFNGNEANIIYVDGQFNARNNHVRYNYIHDASPDAREILLGCGVVFDDLGENNYAYGNVFKNMNGGVGINGGDNNIVDGNIVIDCIDSITASDRMYGKEQIYGENMLSDVTQSRLTNRYYNYRLGDNSAWIRRYPYAAERILYFENASAVWNTGNHDGADMLFARAATGNYIINNTTVNSQDASIGPYFTNYTIETNPAEGIPNLNGNDYSVLYNNIQLSNADELCAGIVNEAGLKREHTYFDNNRINVIYPNNEYVPGNVMDVVWSSHDNANFYRVTVAEDAEFSNITTQKWVIDNRYRQKFQTYPKRSSTYYYKIEAFNFGERREPFAVSEIKSVTFSPYKQDSDMKVISPEESNLAASWRLAVGTQYIRTVVEDLSPEQMSDGNGKYVRFTAPSNTENFRAIWGNYAYRTAETFNDVYDSNTILSMEMQVRFPSDNAFGDYADIPAPQMSPCATAEDTVLGTHGKMLYFRVQKSGDNYILYKGLSGNSTPITQIGEYTANELFGRWITVKVDIDMTTGQAVSSFDGIFTNTDMNYTNWGTNYKWNSENYLRFFDFVLNNNSVRDFMLDIKNVSVIRKIK